MILRIGSWRKDIKEQVREQVIKPLTIADNQKCKTTSPRELKKGLPSIFEGGSF